MVNTIEKEMKKNLWRQRIGYGSSDFACNLIWQVISLYLLYFYTDVMHLNAAAVSVLFLVTKIFDGFTDLAVGFLIDRTNTKWGKSRPWIFAGAIPFAVTAVLAFSVPDISQKGMLIYAYVTYMLLSLAYTVVNIPMAAILPALTADPRERTNLATSRVFFSSVGSTVVSAFALKLVDQLGGENEALGFRIVMTIFGIIGCLVFFFCFFNTKERVRVSEEKVSLKASLSCLFHNKPWLLFAANIIWFFGGYVIQAGAIIYYFTYNLENKELSSVAATITTLIPVVTNLCVPFLSRLATKRNLMIAGSVLHGAGLVLVFIGGKFIPLVLLGVVVAALGYGLKGSMHFAIQPDPVDYGEWKSGINISGTLSAVNGFIGKVGMAVASSIAAAMLAASGYVANAPVQSASALNAISAMYIWIPIATNILTIVTFLFYDLDKRLPEINRELEARRKDH
ncbi:glycoside-pentoside-hexuronide (GPH):cation symporter [Lacrimispora sp. JR3]|uniref:glycoside-pentoside-hexuronide (GPH):cation symporter n=1 Tax=Lacrimispora sinapis TaxID=3111456 RepID=UPI003748414B